jgi:hypothetical protein
MIDENVPGLSRFVLQKDPDSPRLYAYGIKTASNGRSYFVRTAVITHIEYSIGMMETLFGHYFVTEEIDTEEYRQFVLAMFGSRAYILPEHEIFHLPLSLTIH